MGPGFEGKTEFSTATRESEQPFALLVVEPEDEVVEPEDEVVEPEDEVVEPEDEVVDPEEDEVEEADEEEVLEDEEEEVLVEGMVPLGKLTVALLGQLRLMLRSPEPRVPFSVVQSNQELAPKRMFLPLAPIPIWKGGSFG